MTLALLLTAVTGAWAADTYTVQFKALGNTKTVENVTLPHTFGCNINDEIGRGTDELDVIIQELYGLSGSYCLNTVPESDKASVTCGVDDADFQYIIVSAPFEGTATVTGKYIDSNYSVFDYTLEITLAEPTADPNAIDLKWDAATKTGTFTMPAYDVEIAPIYAPVAQWAKVENVDQLPTAIEGIYAESTDAIVKAGTVAKIGETENPQGIVMYAVTSTNQATAPALSAFSADVPTAKDIKVGSEVLVWYYIKGADTPKGQEATAENTFNDSEICATPITVTVLSNKFDITFKAANDNTIETGKATVKVGDEAAEVKEGKLTGVKMDSKVSVTAKEGYKFRKVEVKKKAAAKPLANATTEDLGKVVCAAGHLHDAKTAVPRSCTAVGILGKVTTTGHGLILALSDATSQTWNTINGWTSVTTYASTTLKQLPDDTARGSNLTSYSTLGSTTVSNWCVAQKSDYEAIFTNLGSTTGDSDGMTFDGNVNAYITTGVGGTAITDVYWSATYRQGNICWSFDYISWGNYNKTDGLRVRPVLAF